jgi:hypothetical protein
MWLAFSVFLQRLQFELSHLTHLSVALFCPEWRAGVSQGSNEFLVYAVSTSPGSLDVPMNEFLRFNLINQSF